MDLMPSDEQTEIASTVGALLAQRVPVVGGGATDIDPALWRECCELGWLSLGLPEAAGGVGYSLAEEAVLFRELGRGLAPGPFLPGVLAAHLAAAAGDLDLVAAITSGEERVALGTPVGLVTLGSSVTGEFSITHAAGAHHVVICTPDVSVLVPAASCAIEEVDGVDRTLPVGRALLSGVAASVVVPSVVSSVVPSVVPSDVVPAAALYDRALVLAAATSVGIAQGVMHVAVEYAKQRQQFGKAIGSYQAIKHPCADMAVRCDGAEAQVSYASVAVRDGLPGAANDALVAKFWADESARMNGDAAVQVHGAIGFTSEATPYRFVVRAHVLARSLALRSELLDRIIGERPAS